jgi:signal transduction histidine kinase
LSNQAAYHEKYLTLRSRVVSIYNLNISELERKNVLIEDSALRISNIHQKIGIIGLTILAIFIILIPLFIINPINKLSNRMITFYKTNFNKDIEIKANHELEKLEEIFEKIVIEAKSGQKETM